LVTIAQRIGASMNFDRFVKSDGLVKSQKTAKPRIIKTAMSKA
jgi:hypothetical protein